MNIFSIGRMPQDAGWLLGTSFWVLGLWAWQACPTVPSRLPALLSGLGESLVSAVGLTSAHCPLSAKQWGCGHIPLSTGLFQREELWEEGGQ